jgi:hypothetical protein
MTTQQELDAAMEPVLVRLAQRKVDHVVDHAVIPRAEWALHRSPDNPAPCCGHQNARMVLDWLCSEDVRVRCVPCTRRHYGTEAGDPHWDLRLVKCWVCGDPSNPEPILPRIHLAWPVPAEGGVILRGVEMIEGVPAGWLCPRHEGGVETPIVQIAKWRGGRAAP